jgi:uncharacterized damage-inducible protein DinB
VNQSDIKQLFDYTEWANDRAFKAATQLDDEQLRRDFKISHNSIFGTLLHMAGAEWIWLERWQGRSPAAAEAWSLWKTDSCADLATLSERWHEVVSRRAEFISGLDEAGLMSELSFKLLSGDASTMRLAHQMQHVVNHATLHRGQVVGMIRQLGVEPPSTDMLFFFRNDISPK